MSRVSQVIRYGWLHSRMALDDFDGKGFGRRLRIFFDILYCYRNYRMWSNQYLKERFHLIGGDERERIGGEYLQKGIIRDRWQQDFRETRRFLTKYSSIRYEEADKRETRRKAYTDKYKTGKNLMVEYDVNISRQHYLNGSIKIGDNVLLAKHVFIDYSGDVVIGDNVQLTNGVVIESHCHPFHSDYTASRDIVTPTAITIEEGAVIGSRAIIMPSCHRIGRHARVGAGAVVTKDIPDFAVAVGVPARVVRYQTQPDADLNSNSEDEHERQ